MHGRSASICLKGPIPPWTINSVCRPGSLVQSLAAGLGRGHVEPSCGSISHGNRQWKLPALIIAFGPGRLTTIDNLRSADHHRQPAAARPEPVGGDACSTALPPERPTESCAVITDTVLGPLEHQKISCCLGAKLGANGDRRPAM